MHIKTVKVTNKNNVLLQVPGFVVAKWNLQNEDGIEVHLDSDEQSITLRPKKGFVTVRARGTADK